MSSGQHADDRGYERDVEHREGHDEDRTGKSADGDDRERDPVDLDPDARPLHDEKDEEADDRVDEQWPDGLEDPHRTEEEADRDDERRDPESRDHTRKRRDRRICPL